MEAEEFIDAVEKIKEPEERVVAKFVQEQTEVILNVIIGRRKAPAIIKIIGWVKGQKVVVLLDSGSIHSFVDPQLARISSFGVEDLG